MGLLRKRGLFDSGRITYVPIESITANPDQPRRNFDKGKLEELAASISEHGIIQPLSVRRSGTGYELIAGERRLRAAKMAGLKEVPCIILDVDTCQSAVLALVENICREDLDFIEEAEGIYQMIQVFGMSQEEAAKKLGMSQSAVANKLRILRLPGELLFIIRENGLTERHARALLRLDSDSDRVKVLEQVLRRGLTVSATEKFIDKYMENKKSTAGSSAAPIYIIKDVRLFLNTVDHGVDIMRQAGIDAECGRDDTDTDIVLTIKIPKKPKTAVS